MTEQSEIDTTWLMLRVCHYPQFVEGVVELPWADRYETLKVIYDYGWLMWLLKGISSSFVQVLKSDLMVHLHFIQY